MKWKSFFLGASFGFVGGYTLKKIISEKINLSPEKVLELVKDHFKIQGSIQGSWISMEVESFEKGKIHYKAYRGGISMLVNGASEQYEFIADASTGTIIDVFEL
ncbi:PepSY domain-containing protein [Neobacillus sp. PS3-40]|uniref:PepSY domain-containing protein n=1 Tax=Neobacillus sp. PS3-40 TaxID=3070679 RepID=UPI0027DF3558|nr:PepSY domain-containing protein [Neobacillus sp. PS3-40]WML45691.1 PepSY domain-containing protein [Neobacillus sp. PS3-40]